MAGETVDVFILLPLLNWIISGSLTLGTAGVVINFIYTCFNGGLRSIYTGLGDIVSSVFYISCSSSSNLFSITNYEHFSTLLFINNFGAFIVIGITGLEALLGSG